MQAHLDKVYISRNKSNYYFCFQHRQFLAYTVPWAALEG